MSTKKNKNKNADKKLTAVIVFLCACIVCALAVIVVTLSKSGNTAAFTQSEAQTANAAYQSDSQTEKEETQNASQTAEAAKTEQPQTEAAQTQNQAAISETTQIPQTTTVPQVTDSTSIALAERGIGSVCGKTYISKETGRKVVDPDTENWNLVVVNSSREYVSGYEPKLKEVVSGSGKYLDYRVAPYYDAMYNAAKKDGIILTPYSAYRSYDRQKNNYENLTAEYMTRYSLSKEEAAKKAATVILPPGTSEHNLGLAMDICNTYDSFANTDEYAWLAEHAQDYGFILRYTAEKQPITGIVPEPWHWRFVGVENAKKIKASGLCLEEYLDSLGIEY
ncbi:MAG: D-alanyl-D-alanine carboxypeptidase family protein [Acutalibacteraceae bacterium]